MHYKYHKMKRLFAAQEGFVLVVAVIAIMIMIAVGFLALTVSTQDMRISSRMVGERKAFSAAESGVQNFSASFSPGDGEVSWTFVDSVNDPGAQFKMSKPDPDSETPFLPAPGFGEEMSYAVYGATVTGKDNNYKSQAQIDVGAQYGPITGGFGYE